MKKNTFNVDIVIDNPNYDEAKFPTIPEQFELEVTGCAYPPESQTWDDPGCPAELEITEVCVTNMANKPLDSDTFDDLYDEIESATWNVLDQKSQEYMDYEGPDHYDY